MVGACAPCGLRPAKVGRWIDSDGRTIAPAGRLGKDWERLAIAGAIFSSYTKYMKITYDPAKCERNISERGLSFELAADFEWSSALVLEDRRHDYGERRFQALGFIGDRLHMLVFTPRSGAVHVISLRKANKREASGYENRQS